MSFVLVILAGLVGLAACATTTANEALIQRASREFNCPRERIRTKFLQGNAVESWKVGACGNVVTYLCSYQGVNDPVCVLESSQRGVAESPK